MTFPSAVIGRISRDQTPETLLTFLRSVIGQGKVHSRDPFSGGEVSHMSIDSGRIRSVCEKGGASWLVKDNEFGGGSFFSFRDSGCKKMIIEQSDLQ